MKKVQQKILILAVLILLVIVLIVGFNYYKYRSSINLQQEGFSLISQGKYSQGLEKCAQKPYKIAPCYALAFANMVAKNETVTEEFCASIPLDDKLPFWRSSADKEKYYEEIKDLKTQCYEDYFTRTLGMDID